MTKTNNIELSPEQRDKLLESLKARFEKNLNRHDGLGWADVQAIFPFHSLLLICKL